jgi:hypothetical protein
MGVGVCWRVLCAVFHGKIQVVDTITAYPGEGKKHVNGLCVMSGGGAGFVKALVRVRCLQASRVVRGSAGWLWSFAWEKRRKRGIPLFCCHPSMLAL